MKNVLLPVFMILVSFASQGQTNSIAIKNEILYEGRYEAKKKEVKKNVVKLYSTKEKGTVIITSHRSFDVQLYIFDLESTIIHQGILKSRQKTKISNLAKGTYTYIIFSNEVSIEEGQLIIK